MMRFPGNLFSNPPWRVSLDDELHKYVERKTMETPVAVRTFFWESLLPHLFVLQEIFFRLDPLLNLVPWPPFWIPPRSDVRTHFIRPAGGTNFCPFFFFS